MVLNLLNCEIIQEIYVSQMKTSELKHLEYTSFSADTMVDKGYVIEIQRNNTFDRKNA